MSRRLRIAAASAAFALLAGCAQVPADSIPGPSAPPPAVTTVASPSPAVSSSPEAAPPPSPSATAVQADTATGGGSTTNGGSGACTADEYRNVDGVCVHRPVQADQPPPGATAQCNDGTYSFSTHRSGTCSGHHGVRRWL